MKKMESYLLRTFTLPEKITERKVIVYKSHIDQKIIRVTAEKMKTQLFRKYLLMKPSSEEVQITSIEKYFEPYVVVGGEYRIEYTKNWNQNVQVEDTLQELTIYDGKIKPASLKDHLETPCKIVKINGEARHRFTNKAHLIFNNKWSEVDFDQLPYVPFEEQPETILKSFDENNENKLMSNGKEVELLKSRIVNRPKDILYIHNELFKVSERALIYKPMYKVRFQNIKTKKSIIVIFDAITGKKMSTKKDSKNKKEKKQNKSKPLSKDLPPEKIEKNKK